MFVNANQKLPTPTKILVGATNSLRELWWLFILAIAGILCLALAALRDKRIRLYIDALMLKLPLVGTLNRKLQLARFARTLGSLLKGGVKITSAINTTKGTTTNSAFAGEIGNIEEAVLKGSGLAKAIGRQRYFSEIAANMTAVGEDTGTLPEMLLEVAEIHDQEFESAVNSATSLLGPVMIAALGLIIGFVVLAVLLPIFESGTIID